MSKKGQDTIYYPVSLNIRGRKCLVIGGGQVAARKVKGLLEHGAAVEVISPELCPELADLTGNGEITARTREYRTGDLEGVFMAIIATDDSRVNREAAAEARKRAVLVNVVDNAEESDFIAPSHLRRGAISIAISTSGKSPALARKLRIRLEEEFGEEYARLASLLSAVRAEVMEKKLKINGEVWQQAIDLDRLIEMLKRGEDEEARTTVLAKLKAGERLSQ